MSENGQTWIAAWLTVASMELDRTTLYQALLARDRRFDGWFYIGVTSTGIYCRPVCAVRTPQERNCQFFNSQAAAEKAGFRPCLRCRPELAPGLGVLDVSKRLAHAAAQLIDDGFLATADLTALAERVGVSERHLRRIFLAEFSVTPVEYAQTQRLLLAKRLLTDTRMELGEVAFASGFGSVRRFNALFQSRYRLAPGRFRKDVDTSAGAASRAASSNGRGDKSGKGPKGDRGGASDVGDSGGKFDLSGKSEKRRKIDKGGGRHSTLPEDTIRFELAYRPPYAWDAVLGFLAHRRIDGVEMIADGAYSRVVSFDSPTGPCTGRVQIHDLPARNAIEIIVDTSLASVVPAVLGAMRRVFDLNCRPDLVDPVLGDIAADLPGMRVPGAVDGFEIAVRAIIGQQISVPHARTILAKFAVAFGRRLDREIDAGNDTDGVGAKAVAEATSERPSEGGASLSTSTSASRPRSSVTSTSSLPLAYAFPTAASFAEAGAEHLRDVGNLTRARAQTLYSLAVEVASGRLRLAPLEPLEATLDGLLAIKGIGEWTAQYVAMRALSWPNAFPGGDLILRRQLGVETAKEANALAAQWAPWRAYATVHLWRHFERAKREANHA